MINLNAIYWNKTHTESYNKIWRRRSRNRFQNKICLNEYSMHQTVDSISYIYLEKIILLTKLIECHICLTLGSNVSAKSVGLGITSVYTRVVIYVSDVDLDASMILAGNQSVGPRAVHNVQGLVCLLLFFLCDRVCFGESLNRRRRNARRFFFI